VAARLSVEWLNAIRFSSPLEGALNPGNQRLKLPQVLGQTDLRANLRVEAGPRVQFIVRPRARAYASSASVDEGQRTVERDAEANWTELYVALIPHDAVSVTWGLQNFQWGPAELLAPNNRVFHEVGVFRDPLYYVRGKHLLRVNLSAGKQWSAVALAELGANGDEPFRAGEQFARQVLGKVEFTTADGASYGGVTAGATDGTPPWFGAYGSLALSEGLSIYADGSHTHGSRAWYPVRTAAGRPAFARPFADVTSGRVLAVAGGRYTFARGDDLRIEWLASDAGWSRDDLRAGFAAARVATSAEAFAPYLLPGLEFLGRQLVYVSLRTPDLPPSRRTQVQTRYLHSFTDTSRVFFVTGSFDTTDSLVIFASGTATGGPPEGEFSRFVGASVVLGATYTW
jgi:hypothetical protein